MRNIADNGELTVSVIERESSTATLCFTGIGHAIGGIDVQSPEFIRCSNTSTALFIVDKKRSWGNNLDFTALQDLLAPYTSGRTLNAIGNSMGGFLAVLATRFFTIDAAIAFVPQYSVSKRIIPAESRFDKYVDDIRNWQFESLHGCFNERTQYYLLFGPGEDDTQRTFFPNKANVHKISFRAAMFEHNVAQHLKEHGLLYDVIGACFSKTDPNTIVQEQLSDESFQAFVG
jgi:hypothetical protein